MRVLLVHNYYQHFGGEDAAAQDDFQLLATRGVDVKMFSRHNDEIKSYGAFEKAIFPIKAISSSDNIERLENTLKEFPADVAYLHNIYPLISPSVYRALERCRIPGWYRCSTITVLFARTPGSTQTARYVNDA